MDELEVEMAPGWMKCPECDGKGSVTDMTTPVHAGDPIREAPTRICPKCDGAKRVRKPV